MNSHKKKIYFLIPGILLGAAILCTLVFGHFFTQGAEVAADGRLQVQFIDVGEADASLIRLPNGKTMMIDAGGNATADSLVDYIRSQGVKKIDYLIATHPHEDHIGGMDKVIDHFHIGAVYMPKVDDSQVPTTRTYRDVLTSLSKKKLKVKQGKAGTVIFDEDGVKAEIIAPNSAAYQDLNSYSIVIRLTYGKNRFLFMGDAQSDSEKEILQQQGADGLKADVIKCGHHGSSTSSSSAFISAVDPQYAVISCGKGNSYGHPHMRTLDVLKKCAAVIYRTDEQQTITALCDGNHISFTTGGTSCAQQK